VIVPRATKHTLKFPKAVTRDVNETTH